MDQINQCGHPAAPLGPNELVGLLAHDARTPLNAVRGFAELLLAGAGGPLSDTALGHLIEIARAGRAIEAALGLAQQLAEYYPAGMSGDGQKVDLARLLAEGGFAVPPHEARQVRRAILVAPIAWRAAIALCRGHLSGGEASSSALPAEIGEQSGQTLDLTLRCADMHGDRPLSVLAERLLVALLGEAGAVVRSSPPHRPIVIRLTLAAVQGPVVTRHVGNARCGLERAPRKSMV